MKSVLATLLLLVIAIQSGCGGGGENGASTAPASGDSDRDHGASAGFTPPGAVVPSPETIESGDYKPLSRPLFLYVNKASLKRPEVVAFLQYYISAEGQSLVGEVGYVKLSQETFGKTSKILSDAIAAAGTSVDGKLSGEIKIDGSSTVYPVSQAVTEDFTAKHRGVKPIVSKSGTGGGMKRFYVGEIDICDASRAIKETEIIKCKEEGIEYIELQVGIDGLTVVVNSENDWVSGMTVEELKTLWAPESQIKKWSDLNPDFPDEEIVLYGPDTDSGTFEYFTEEICGEKGASRSDYNQSPDDNFLVTGVAGDKYAIGYFGFAYYIENQDTLKALGVAP